MKKPIISLTLVNFYVLLLFSLSSLNVKAQDISSMFVDNWPEWRGLYNTGASLKGNPPVEFSETKNIKWRIEIPGKGHATPIILGDQIIIETAIATDKKPAIVVSPNAQPTGRRGPSGPQAEFIHKFMVISVDKNTGKLNWQTVVKEEFPIERTHELGSWASNSPATDGENIYAYFGSRGLFCLDLKGNIKWERDFGQMEKVASFGEGSSPAISKDNVFVQWDHEGQSYIYAIDKTTGKDVWVKERDERSSWATPLVIEVNGKTQVITAATNKVRSYDATNGDVIWELTGLTRNVIPNPLYADGIVYLMSGYQGTALKAVDLDKAKGDITGTSTVLWEYNQDTPYTPSAVLMDGKLYFLRNNNGMMTCLDAKTGEVKYSNQKLDGITTLYSSPTGAGGKIYIAATNKINVIKAGADFEILKINELDDTFHASPVVVGEELFLRGFKHLYCISEK